LKKRFIQMHYEDRISDDMDHHQILGWESKDAQQARFKVLTDNIILTGKRLLDVGCGLGDLYKYLKESSIKCRYTGVDISEKMILRASRVHPDAEFYFRDVFEGEHLFEENSFDIVYSSGIFNLNLGNNLDFLSDAVRIFHFMSSSYTVFNLLSEKSANKESQYYYYNIEQISELIKKYFSNYKIVEYYLENDFTVIGKK